MHEELDPSPDDIISFGSHELLKVAPFLAFQRTLAGHLAEFNADHAPILDDNLSSTLSSGMPAMHMDRFVFIRIKANLKAEIFIELWHLSSVRCDCRRL